MMNPKVGLTSSIGSFKSFLQIVVFPAASSPLTYPSSVAFFGFIDMYIQEEYSHLLVLETRFAQYGKHLESFETKST